MKSILWIKKNQHLNLGVQFFAIDFRSINLKPLWPLGCSQSKWMCSNETADRIMGSSMRSYESISNIECAVELHTKSLIMLRPRFVMISWKIMHLWICNPYWE